MQPVVIYAAEGDTASAADTIPAGEAFTARTGNVHLTDIPTVVLSDTISGYDTTGTVITLTEEEVFGGAWVLRGRQLPTGELFTTQAHPDCPDRIFALMHSVGSTVLHVYFDFNLNGVFEVHFIETNAKYVRNLDV